MHKKLIIFSLMALTFILIFPPFLYFHGTRNLLTTLPNKEHPTLEEAVAKQIWKYEETCTPVECSSITPYWLYRWLGVAIISDNITNLDISSAYGNVSSMSSAIAFNWVSSGNYKGKGNFWWHLTSATLSIYIQRNWSVREITTAYRAISA